MLSNSDTLLLAECLKQLQLKTSVFTELGEKMIEKVDDEEKVEATVFKSAKLQAMLSEKIALVAQA